MAKLEARLGSTRHAAQILADGNTERFLPAAQENAAMNFAAAIKAGKLVIEEPGKQHPPERL